MEKRRGHETKSQTDFAIKVFVMFLWGWERGGGEGDKCLSAASLLASNVEVSVAQSVLMCAVVGPPAA